MSLSRIRNIKNDNLTWPGFVDALAALLMVVIFVLLIFSIAQFYLNQIVSGQDEALFDLNKEINSLYNLLQIEKDQNSDLKNQINIINIKLENANKEISIKKNENYLSYCQSLGSKDILPGVYDFIHASINKGLKLAVGSASKNAKIILQKLGIIDLFSIIVDGNIVEGILAGFIAGGTRPASHYVDIYEAYLAVNKSNPGFYTDEQIAEKRIHAERATSIENIRKSAAENGLEFNIPWQGYRQPNMFADSTPYGTSYVHPTRGTLILAGFNLLGMAEKYHIGCLLYTSPSPRDS